MSGLDLTTSQEELLASPTGQELVRISSSSDGGVTWSNFKTTLAAIAALASAFSLDWVIPTAPTDAAMAVAVAAINGRTNGGVLYLPAGTYSLANAYTFTKPVTMMGEGCANALMTGALTNVQSTSKTNNLFTFTVNPWQIKDCHFGTTASGAPTAGAGIYGQYGSGHRLTNVTVRGFWNNIQIDNAAEWYWTNVVSYGPVNYGCQINDIASPDGGDQGIVNCQFIAADYNSAAAVRYESGGGLRMTNCKINMRGSFNFSIGIDVAMSSIAATSDFLLSNTSIENTTSSSIRMRNTSGGTMPNIHINNVQCANYGATVPAIDIAATGTGVFDRLNIANCSFSINSSSSAAISITNVNNVAIGLCTQLGHPQLIVLSNVTNYRNDNARLGTGQLGTTGTIAVDCTNAENFNCNMTANGVLALPTNAASGVSGAIRVTTNGHTLTFASGWKFPNGVAPTLGNGHNMLSYQYDGFDNTFWIGLTNGLFS